MQCPHCLEFFKERGYVSDNWLGEDRLPDEDYERLEEITGENPPPRQIYKLRKVNCHACGMFIAILISGPAEKKIDQRSGRIEYEMGEPIKRRFILPPVLNRVRFSTTIPENLKNDYDEAVAVLPFSEKASAALSRRCLQNIIRELAHIKKGSLNDEIQELLEKGNLPQYVAEPLDSVRAVGNFAAHPIKSQTMGVIVDVEPSEADLCLRVIESLFDFYIIEPKKQKSKLAAINKKLIDAGKPPLKGPLSP